MGHTWRPIEPLAADWQSWADSELAAIRVVWNDLQKSIGEQSAAKLHERMLTEWGIETGMVEDLYRWDRDVTETLLAGGVRADRIPEGSSQWTPDLLAQVILDQIEVVEGLFSFVKSERPLGTSFVHELHAQLLRSVPPEFELGKWKTLPNVVRLQDGSVHQYCPPEHVAAEMDRLLELNAQYERENVPVEIRAAWLHHRFTQIHPYPDGNGRTARALASLLLVKEALFPLIIRRDEKSAYLDALEAADRGDDEPLIERIKALQRREALKMSESIPLEESKTGPSPTMEETIRRIGLKLAPELVRSSRWASLPEKTGAVYDEATGRINSVIGQLNTASAGQGGFSFRYSTSPGATMDIQTDGKDYEPQKSEYGRSVFLKIVGPRPATVGCEIHATSVTENGMGACVVYLDDEKQKVAVGSDYFLITYAEPTFHLEARFKKWLEKKLIKALDLWQQRL